MRTAQYSNDRSPYHCGLTSKEPSPHTCTVLTVLEYHTTI